MLHLLRGAAAGRRIDDAPEPVERAGGQLLDGEVDVGATDVLVEERRALGQLLRVDVALQSADYRPRGEGRRLRAGERLLRMERHCGAEGRGAGAGCGGCAEKAEGFTSGVSAAPGGRIGHRHSPVRQMAPGAERVGHPTSCDSRGTYNG
ncbi:MAG: hypothetical protein J4G16_13350 [Acidobacteria bacterium]|nr:hypothetical protein [Acidobacteriota bacterium]